ncbi:hypothetical protein Y032_0008g131 [Ancylostoma ceylanicum]|uniref:Uncharacterized protein n=1 Tax=Ancylostoma ceylanicum TaxID=53326 RepID=A0A016VK88_9BILA|nr:hypothetical protein Y032_0008g131 [Ancylostoma ceylanicum]
MDQLARVYATQLLLQGECLVSACARSACAFMMKDRTSRIADVAQTHAFTASRWLLVPFICDVHGALNWNSMENVP